MGIKPVRGGRPPRDKRIRGVIEVITGALDQEVASIFTVVALFNLKTRNVEKVIIK